MAEVEKERSKMSRVMKIELGVTIAAIGLVLGIMLQLVSYGRGEEGQNQHLKQLRIDVDRALENSEKIPVIENDVKYLRKSSDEMSQSIQILINRK